VRLVLTSDLHVDHHPEVVGLVAERVRSLEPDVLVVAGDVSADPARVEATLSSLRAAAPRLVFVPGNHDLWVGADGASSRERYESILPARVRNAGGDLLPVEIGGIHFVGVTGWYDFSLRRMDLDIPLDDYRRGVLGRLRWNDVARVVWPGCDGPEAICAEMVTALEQQLAIAGPKVVVTHHLPFAELVTSFGELPWDFLNGFMGSARLGEAIARASDVLLACCGHTHFRKSLVVNGIPAEASPVGYPREYRRAGRDLVARVAERVTLLTQPAASDTSINVFRPGSSLGRAAD
jgi:Icc-related predicted phosphoesterase